VLPKKKAVAKNGPSANIGFERKLCAADKMCGHMDPAEYKHVLLGLTFLKYISDAFEERQASVLKEKNADLEDRDEYIAESVFWVPKEAPWPFLQKNAKRVTIGKLIDDAMLQIKKANPSLKGVLPKGYARPARRPEKAGRADGPLSGPSVSVAKSIRSIGFTPRRAAAQSSMWATSDFKGPNEQLNSA